MNHAPMPELFRHFPELRERLPWVTLARATPVERLGRLESYLHGGPVWVKRDDQTSRAHAGGKPRELEFLFGDLLRRGAQRVLAFGPADSDDCLAITTFARRFGVQAVLALTRPASAERAASTLEIEHALGAELHRLDGGPRALWRLLRSGLARADAEGSRRPLVAWPRRLALSGALGYVNAVYELQRQINCRILPAPARIYVPARTGAAAAGILLGCQLADLPCTVVIAPPRGRKSPRPERLAAGAFGALARRSRRIGGAELRNGALEVRVASASPSASPGSPSLSPEVLLRDLEALDLDSQFAASAMAALIEDQRHGASRSPVLFWHTRPARQFQRDRRLRPADLPQEFREFFVSP